MALVMGFYHSDRMSLIQSLSAFFSSFLWNSNVLPLSEYSLLWFSWAVILRWWFCKSLFKKNISVYPCMFIGPGWLFIFIKKCFVDYFRCIAFICSCVGLYIHRNSFLKYVFTNSCHVANFSIFYRMHEFLLLTVRYLRSSFVSRPECDSGT